MAQIYSNPKRASDPHALPDVETFEIAKGGLCPACEGAEQESRDNYLRAYERETAGLTAISSGFNPECGECVSNYGYHDIENDDGDVTTTAEEQAQADYDSGKLSGEGGFSWQDCDTCGQSLGGDREAGHGLDNQNRLVHLSMCVDCVMFTANGDVPENWPDGDEPEHADHIGFYWQACFPGCLPDGEPVGPFATEQEAIADAQADVIDDDIPAKLCPVCGVPVVLIGETTDGRLIGSCRDAFTRKQWESDSDDNE